MPRDPAEIDNLRLATEFNRLFSERRTLAAAVSREMRNQLELATQIATIVGGMKPEEIASKLEATRKAMEELSTSSKGTGDAATKATDAVVKGFQAVGSKTSTADKHLKNFSQKFPFLASISKGVMSGLAQGFVNVINLARAGVGLMQGVTSSIWNIGKAIVAIPIKIFQGLVDLASDFTGDTSFMQAIENVRKEFGSFKEDVSKNVVGAFKEAQAGITNTGLSTFRVLGTFAQQLDYFREQFAAAGAEVHKFGKEIAADAGSWVGFQKGLGIANEEIKGFLDRATIFGTTWQKQMVDTANYTLQMGAAFGISQKVLGRDIAGMVKDVKNFGSLTQKEMSVAAVYTRKLGLEVKNLLGLVDKFDTFEDAANSAAMLSQSFGTAVDAFKLMQEQDPAKRLDMLRKSMAAAGKTTENMSRQELKLLSQTTGLDEATAKLAFSAKNQGVSYDEVQKQAAKAENAQMRQAKALEKLADSIERIVMQGQLPHGGFVDKFLKGMEVGIKSSPAFLQMIWTLRRALWETYMTGIRVGKMFVATFPGLSEIFKSVTASFKGFPDLLGKISKNFGILFKTQNVQEFFENMQASFRSFFTGSGATRLLGGIKTFGSALSKVFASALEYAVKGLTSGFKRIGELFADKRSWTDALAGAGSTVASQVLNILKPIVDVFRNKELWEGLYKAFTGMLQKMWERTKEWVRSHPAVKKVMFDIIKSVAFVMFAPAVTRGATAAFAGGLLKIIAGGGQQAIKIAETKGKGENSVGKQVMMSSFGNPYAAAAALAVAVGVASVGMKKGLDKFSKELEKDTKLVGTKTEKQAAASLAGIVQMLSFGQVSDKMALELAKNFTTYAHELFAQIKSVFGPKLGEAIKTNFEEQLGFFTDLGGLISSLISGDAGGIVTGVTSVMERIFKIAVNNLRLVLIDVPTKIIEFVADTFSKAADTLFEALSRPDSSQYIMKKVEEAFSSETVESHFLPQLWNSFKNLFEALAVKLPWAIVRLGAALLLNLGKYVFGGQMALDTAQMIKDFAHKWQVTAKEEFEKFIAWIPQFGSKVWAAMKDALSPAHQASILKKGFLDIANAFKGKAGAAPEEAATSSAASLSAGIIESSSAKARQAATVAGAGEEAPASDKLMQAQMTLEGVKAVQELKKIDVQKEIDSAAAMLGKIDLGKLDTGVLQRVDDFGKLMTSFGETLEKSSSDVAAKLTPTLKATQDIIASVKELDAILASGDATRIAVSKKLSKFAQNAGLGGNERYTITNKGVQINMDLKVVMNAEELEEALVLRHKSIIKEAIKSSLNLATDEAIRDKIRLLG